MYSHASDRRSASDSKTQRRGSPGKRCYAIGDVHGRLDLLEQLITEIDAHNAERDPRETAIVLLGDLIDRGPDSRGVIDFVLNFQSRHARLFLISGNHEEMLLRALDGDVTTFQTWMANGGEATARSYGVTMDDLRDLDGRQMIGKLHGAIPPTHLALLRSAADSIRFGDYLLVHAGIRPGVPLAEQTPADLRWIRRHFLESDIDHGLVVIHGHSTRSAIEARPNRIGIDTGAYRTGTLTAIWIEGTEHGFLRAQGSATEDWTSDLF